MPELQNGIVKKGDSNTGSLDCLTVRRMFPSVPVYFPKLCMYLMGTNGSSAYRSASWGKWL